MNRKRKAFIILCLLTGCLGFGIFFSGNPAEAQTPPILRLHVVADSDAEFDQAIKLEVRDAVIDMLREELQQAKDMPEAKKIISNMLPQIEAAANKVLAERADYWAKAELGKAQFPTKGYGDLVLPAGKYEALRIVLGSGEGKNWWCVLFPSLCFVDAVGEIDDAMAVSTGKASGLKIKWKIIELLRGEK
ncbi:MAG: stage II sporulation protein R [Firmicutes bacterium]|nr:stage II sporulation protein R [Bacillota bacterium]